MDLVTILEKFYPQLMGDFKGDLFKPNNLKFFINIKRDIIQGLLDTYQNYEDLIYKKAKDTKALDLEVMLSFIYTQSLEELLPIKGMINTEFNNICINNGLSDNANYSTEGNIFAKARAIANYQLITKDAILPIVSSRVNIGDKFLWDGRHIQESLQVFIFQTIFLYSRALTKLTEEQDLEAFTTDYIEGCIVYCKVIRLLDYKENDIINLIDKQW
jgi:hypothetical protein